MLILRKTVFLVTTLLYLVIPGYAQQQGNRASLSQGSHKVLSATELYDHVAPSVTTILVYDRSGKQIKSGSGVIVSSDGSVLTNYHVVEGGYFVDVRVLDASNKSQVLPARPLRANRSQDLAIVRVTAAFPLKVASIASDLPKVGSKAYTIGSPQELEGSISEGIVSQVRIHDGVTLIQTTAAISPGSSGGGLFLDTGELLGITAMTITLGQGLNFAVSCHDLSSLSPVQNFLASSSPVIAEKDPPSLVVAGIKITLGMAKQDFMSRVGNPYVIKPSSLKGSYDIYKQVGNSYESIGSVTFKDDRVCFAHRRWDVGDDPPSTLQALCDVLFANLPEGVDTVTVRSFSTRTPDMREERIHLLFSSGREVIIGSGTYNGERMQGMQESISIWNVQRVQY